SDDFALVEMISNRNVKISAKILRTNTSGILTWSGGDYFNLNNSPTSFDVIKGDIVLSSEYTNKYPDEIPFGVVHEVIDEKNCLFFSVKVKPYVNVFTVDQVFVVKKVPDDERNRLLIELEERLKIKKNIQ